MTICNDHGKSSNCPALGSDQPIVCNFLKNEVETRRIKGVPFSGRSLFGGVNSGKWNTPELQLLIDEYGDDAARYLGRLLWKVLREDTEKYSYEQSSSKTHTYKPYTYKIYTWL